LQLRLPALRLPSLYLEAILPWRCFLVGKARARMRPRERFSSPAIAGEDEERNRRAEGKSEKNPQSKEYRARHWVAEKLAVRAYSDFFGFWRSCRYRACKRAHGCRGDYIDCFVGGRKSVADRFDAARAHVRALTPKKAGAPEREAWTFDYQHVNWIRKRKEK
jgi:hypothetical protein